MLQLDVEKIYEAYPQPVGSALRALRSMVLDVAANTKGVGDIEEALKWGQPSFLTVRPKSGSTIRIDKVRDQDTKYAMYFICNTNLVDRFREHYPHDFAYSGNRALIFDVSEPVPEGQLRHCIAMALTYHL